VPAPSSQAPARPPDAGSAAIADSPPRRPRRRVGERARGNVPRWPRGTAAPVLAHQMRGGVLESSHRGHVVQVGADGRVEYLLGDAEQLVTLRSAVKPFALLPLIESGAADAFGITPLELAVLASSHSGEDLHIRTLQSVLRRAGVSQAYLACGSDGMPLDQVTFLRLAGDREKPGPIRHMCSGYHSAFLLLAKFRGWPMEQYWRDDHPTQVALRDAIARVFAVRPDRLVTAIDNCGVATFAFPLVDVARAYALLAEPGAATDARVGMAETLTRVRDAMLGAPEMIGGTRERLDTELMRAAPGTLVAKGGAEGLRGISILRGARGRPTPAAGLAISIDDGDSAGRAGWVAAVEALRQVGVLDDQALRRLERFRRPVTRDPQGRAAAETVARFELAPVAELA
jgi:L-asparaginase II